MTSARDALAAALAPPMARRSAMVALIVGTVLNAINQGPELVAGDAINPWKLALTYCVPFLVATWGAYAAFRHAEA